ncbi:hypothetical protein LTR37_003912 [Vermiconidia calcicola]|uniref:Uncharacterized protein n=1 Tax=Vermiconidia calcicola TaxID=1690605 RepID=A0ACC3NNP9_9PEZI|nr:hypothetical protein LTR37_003912 [Vermiconidia calcicola]
MDSASHRPTVRYTNPTMTDATSIYVRCSQDRVRRFSEQQHQQIVRSSSKYGLLFRRRKTKKAATTASTTLDRAATTSAMSNYSRTPSAMSHYSRMPSVRSQYSRTPSAMSHYSRMPSAMSYYSSCQHRDSDETDPSHCSSTQCSRCELRQESQDRIPDWVDDVVQSQLIAIAEELKEDVREGLAYGPEQERPSSPLLETERVGMRSPMHFAGVDMMSVKGVLDCNTSSSSASETSVASSSICNGETSCDKISPVTPQSAYWASPIPSAPHWQGFHRRQSSNKSCSSSDVGRNSDASIYSQRSSATCLKIETPDSSTSGIVSDRVMRKDFASKTFSIISPVNAGVFDDPRQSLNQPLSPNMVIPSENKRSTFIVVAEVVQAQEKKAEPIHSDDSFVAKASATLTGPFIDPFEFGHDFEEREEEEEEEEIEVQNGGLAELEGDQEFKAKNTNEALQALEKIQRVARTNTNLALLALGEHREAEEKNKDEGDDRESVYSDDQEGSVTGGRPNEPTPFRIHQH